MKNEVSVWLFKNSDQETTVFSALAVPAGMAREVCSRLKSAAEKKGKGQRLIHLDWNQVEESHSAYIHQFVSAVFQIGALNGVMAQYPQKDSALEGQFMNDLASWLKSTWPSSLYTIQMASCQFRAGQIQNWMKKKQLQGNVEMVDLEQSIGVQTAGLLANLYFQKGAECFDKSRKLVALELSVQKRYRRINPIIGLLESQQPEWKQIALELLDNEEWEAQNLVSFWVKKYGTDDLRRLQALMKAGLRPSAIGGMAPNRLKKEFDRMMMEASKPRLPWPEEDANRWYEQTVENLVQEASRIGFYPGTDLKENLKARIQNQLDEFILHPQDELKRKKRTDLFIRKDPANQQWFVWMTHHLFMAQTLLDETSQDLFQNPTIGQGGAVDEKQLESLLDLCLHAQEKVIVHGDENAEELALFHQLKQNVFVPIVRDEDDLWNAFQQWTSAEPFNHSLLHRTSQKSTSSWFKDRIRTSLSEEQIQLLSTSHLDMGRIRKLGVAMAKGLDPSLVAQLLTKPADQAILRLDDLLLSWLYTTTEQRFLKKQIGRLSPDDYELISKMGWSLSKRELLLDMMEEGLEPDWIRLNLNAGMTLSQMKEVAYEYPLGKWPLRYHSIVPMPDSLQNWIRQEIQSVPGKATLNDNEVEEALLNLQEHLGSLSEYDQ